MSFINMSGIWELDTYIRYQTVKCLFGEKTEDIATGRLKLRSSGFDFDKLETFFHSFFHSNIDFVTNFISMNFFSLDFRSM